MLDSSNSIERVQFTEQLHFVAQLLHLFDLDADRTRVGVALFSDDVKEVVALQQCHTLDEIKAVLKDTFFLSGIVLPILYFGLVGIAVNNLAGFAQLSGVSVTEGYSKDECLHAGDSL